LGSECGHGHVKSQLILELCNVSFLKPFFFSFQTSPFLWYFYSAIPRSLLSSLFLVPIGLYVNRRVRVLLLPCLLFMFFYSFLPHKELRFIIYVIPVFNVCAAAGCDQIWKNRGKGLVPALLSVGILFHLVLNSVIATGFLAVSRMNYPGGTALLQARTTQFTPSFILPL